MKRTVSTETKDIDSTKTESLIRKKTPNAMADHEPENSSCTFVTSEKVTWQIKAMTDPHTQQMKRLCEILQEVEEE